MPKNILTVNMNEVRFNTDESTVVTTEGLTTCIAFIIQGSFWDEDDDEISFCGLYHWSGFEDPDEDPDKQARKALLFFLTKLREFAGVEEDTEITIDLLKFIGGEKEQRDSEDKLIVSGTEAEVNSLIKAVKEFNFAKYHFRIDPKVISHQHFLTKNEQTISIGLSLSDCRFVIINPIPTEEPNSDLSIQLS